MHSLDEKESDFGVATGWRRFANLRQQLENTPVKRSQLWVAIGFVVLFYLFLTAAQASRHLWHDELYTYYIARSASLREMWRNIPLDLNPPLIFLAERFSIGVFGDNLYAARIPSILFFLIGSLCLYKFVADHLRPVYGILAMFFFWATPFEYFATEARPYGLIIGFFGLAIVAWDKARQPIRSSLSVWCLGLTVLGMTCSHVLAPIYVIPFVVAELVRWYRLRRFDWPIWTALLWPWTVLLVCIPLVRRYKHGSFPAATEANPLKAIGFFYRMLEPESFFLLLALCVGLLAAWQLNRSRVPPSRTSSPFPWSFVWSLALIPFLVIGAMMLSHGAAFPRYSGPAVFLLAILFVFLLATYSKSSRLAALAASGILFLYLAEGNAGLALSAARLIRNRGGQPSPSPLVRIRPDLPLVAASGINFLELDKYADPVTVDRLYYLTGQELALRYSHATIFEGMRYLTTRFPIRAKVEPYKSFVVEHPNFLALGNINYHEDWLLRQLNDIHASLQYLGVFYGSDLYLVTMPGHAVPQLSDVQQ